MAVLLDTSVLPLADRPAALGDAMASAAVPAWTTPQHGEVVHARLEAWALGVGATLLRRQSTGVRILRTPRQVRENAADRVALTLLSPGAWRFSQSRAEHAPASSRGTLILVDHSAPYEFNRYDSGTTIAVNLDLDALDLPRDTVRAAARRLTPRHHLHDLLSHQLRFLAHRARHDEAHLHPLHAATEQLARALITDAAGDTRRAREAFRDSLFARSQLWIALHATESDLTPERVARAHHVSLRLLHTAWQGTGTSVGRAIVRQRLAVGRQLLTDPTCAHLTIAEIARRAGFADATHFSHRFRDAFGASPRGWRSDQRAAAATRRAGR